MPTVSSDGRTGSPSAPSTSVSRTPSSGSQAPPEPPPSLWSLQPNEPAADYQIFAAWLQLSAPRHFGKAATALGCSVYRLRRLAPRNNWRTRAAAFDNHRANAASVALDQLLRDEDLSWQDRVQRFRLQEWLLHEEMLQAALAAARELQKHPSRASLNDLVKVMELASVLGRRACGMPLDPAAVAKPEPPSSYPDAEAALRKIYGSDAPGKPAGSQEAVP